MVIAASFHLYIEGVVTPVVQGLAGGDLGALLLQTTDLASNGDTAEEDEVSDSNEPRIMHDMYLKLKQTHKVMEHRDWSALLGQ